MLFLFFDTNLRLFSTDHILRGKYRSKLGIESWKGKPRCRRTAEMHWSLARANEQKRHRRDYATYFIRQGLLSLTRYSPLNFQESLDCSENAFDLANYCHSYRQCLLMLQLWSCAYPAPNSSPVNDLCGIQKDEGTDSFTSQALYNRGNREKLAPFYHSGLRFIAVNRWKLIDAGARMRELNKCSSLEDDENIYKLRRFTSGIYSLQNKNLPQN